MRSKSADKKTPKSEDTEISKSDDTNISKLEFVRIFTPVHIPEYLVDQVRDKDFTTEQFYKFQEICCLRQSENGPVLNPLNFLYVIVNESKMAKGFMWGQADPLTNDFIIQTFSIDKEYWGNGRAVKMLTKKVKEILKECSMNKVYWITNFAKHAQRYGFKRSKSVLFEYNETSEVKEEKDGRNIETEASRDITIRHPGTV